MPVSKQQAERLAEVASERRGTRTIKQTAADGDDVGTTAVSELGRFGKIPNEARTRRQLEKAHHFPNGALDRIEEGKAVDEVIPPPSEAPLEIIDRLREIVDALEAHFRAGGQGGRGARSPRR